ncbi:MAG: hypothetical protein ACT4OZ_01590 [Gemmatimonadota bacterium]
MRLLLAALSLSIADPIAAQVGHLPAQSPYRDLERRGELSWVGGFYEAAIDPARVAPRDGPFVGAHYEYRLGGPAYFSARSILVNSKRLVLDPTLPIGDRPQGDITAPFLLTDVGITLSLTGFKSWNRLVPTLGAGVGLGAGFDGGRDVGDYRFGFPFLISARPGLKFLVGGKWHARLDATNYFHRVRYPESYYTKTGPDDTVLPVDAPRNFWKRNRAVSLGLTYNFGR